MTRTSPPGSGRPGGYPADDGWGPATAVRAGSGARRDSSAPPRRDSAAPPPRGAQPSGARGPRPRLDDWSSGPASSEQQRRVRVADKRTARAVQDDEAAQRAALRPPERGLRGSLALLVLVVIALIGGLLDTLGGTQVRGGFNIGIVVASVVAILIVKRSHMFPIVIAPPIVYTFAAVFQLYLRSNGLHDKGVVLDAASNYLVYGFPAIAAATAAVLIIAGIRLIARK